MMGKRHPLDLISASRRRYTAAFVISVLDLFEKEDMDVVKSRRFLTVHVKSGGLTELKKGNNFQKCLH